MTRTQTIADEAVGIATIDEVDFTLTPACEHTQHRERHPGDEPAAYVMRHHCPLCGLRFSYLLCAPGWQSMTPTVTCRGCHEHIPLHDLLTIVAVL